MSTITPDVVAIESDVGNVTEARCKLDDILNDIVGKNDDRKPSYNEEDAEHGSMHDHVPPYTPTKKNYSGKINRKRKKKDYFYDELELSNKPSYVIKMFDRRVNLANFNEDTSLYTMLRDWMRNKPIVTTHQHEQQQEKNPEVEKNNDYLITDLIRSGMFLMSESQIESKEEFVYELPDPVKSEEFLPRSLPPALQTSLLEDIINTKDDIESLKKDNMFRWRKVRNRWKEHSLRNQQRHLQSITILNSMTLNLPTSPKKT